MCIAAKRLTLSSKIEVASVLLTTEIVNWEPLDVDQRPAASSHHRDQSPNASHAANAALAASSCNASVGAALDRSSLRHPDASGDERSGMKLGNTDLGCLLVGHGTRRAEGQMQLRELFQQFAGQIAPLPAEMAFLELAQPDIFTAVERLALRGVRRIITVPVLLFSAGHAEQDIPAAVQNAASSHKLTVAAQTSVFESAPAVLELSALRFRQAVCVAAHLPWLPKECSDQGSSSSDQGSGSSGCQLSCGADYCGQVALLMVGRGSSSAQATEKMRQLTAARRLITPAAWAQTAFIHAQYPDVHAGLDQLQSQPQRLKIVQPHLLFEGELMDQLRRQVAERQQRDATSKWILTKVLGGDDQLSHTLVSLVKQALATIPVLKLGVQ